MNGQDQARRRGVRLVTLVRLRWLAVLGQIGALLFVRYGLDFALPLWPCLAVIGLYAAINMALQAGLRGAQRLSADRAAWLLAFDLVELALLLALTGGLQNPFAYLFLGPVLISATALPPRMTLLLAGLAVACASIVMFVHYPLPWSSDDPLELPPIYMMGVWLSILLAIGYISIYTWQVAEEARQFANALAATELVLAREQHISQLDGLAAAAAHELATPLSTIAVVARDLELALMKGPHAEDARILREQALRCREILGKLTTLPAPGEPFERMNLSALIEEVVAPHRVFGIAIDVIRPQQTAAEPVGARNPAILYGLGNLLENAIDHARERVEVAAEWSDDHVAVTIADDGLGIPSDIIGRLGEPYVRGESPPNSRATEKAGGLGLGFFIAKTLLERSGATITLQNRPPPQHGAVIRVSWNRADFERHLPYPAADNLDAMEGLTTYII